jgi:hypothetical protein
MVTSDEKRFFWGAMTGVVLVLAVVCGLLVGVAFTLIHFL